MRIVRLMSDTPKRKRKPWYRILNESQWRARYKALVYWYEKRSMIAKKMQYQKWAVFTLLPDEEKHG